MVVYPRVFLSHTLRASRWVVSEYLSTEASNKTNNVVAGCIHLERSTSPPVRSVGQPPQQDWPRRGKVIIIGQEVMHPRLIIIRNI